MSDEKYETEAHRTARLMRRSRMALLDYLARLMPEDEARKITEYCAGKIADAIIKEIEKEAENAE